MKSNRTTKAILGLLVLLLALAIGFQAWRVPGKSVVRKEFMMATIVTFKVYDGDSHSAAALDRAVAAMKRIDAMMSRQNPESELSRLNAHAGRGPQKVSADLATVINKGLWLGTWSDGAFNIAIGPVTSLWNFTVSSPSIPNPQLLQKKLPLTDRRQVVWDERSGTVDLRLPGMMLDLGGIAKGYALAIGAQALTEAKLHNFLIEAGGDLILRGQKGRQPWTIGIEHPREPGKLLGKVTPGAQAIVTSGDYEQFFFRNGHRYHHVLNPQTGMPGELCRSVTVVGPDPTLADGLATALFILGPQVGLDKLKSLADYSAFVIDADGRRHRSPHFPEVQTSRE